jgi:hypothetical protein
MEDIVRRAHEAMQARSWDDLRFLLHPYLHWTNPDGRTVRGRTKVMAMLAGRDPPPWPTSVEVRDAQIYRWQELPD